MRCSASDRDTWSWWRPDLRSYLNLRSAASSPRSDASGSVGLSAQRPVRCRRERASPRGQVRAVRPRSGRGADGRLATRRGRHTMALGTYPPTAAPNGAQYIAFNLNAGAGQTPGVVHQDLATTAVRATTSASPTPPTGPSPTSPAATRRTA